MAQASDSSYKLEQILVWMAAGSFASGSSLVLLVREKSQSSRSRIRSSDGFSDAKTRISVLQISAFLSFANRTSRAAVRDTPSKCISLEES